MRSSLDVVRRFLDTLGETDSERALTGTGGAETHALVHPDCVFINSTFNPDRGLVDSSEAPEGGVFRGPTGVDEDMALLTRLWDIRVKDPELFALGDVVLFKGVAVATGRATGRSNESDFLEAFWVEDGLITKVHASSDTKALWDLLQA
jgi:ketosteroid isomerase-like protein